MKLAIILLAASLAAFAQRPVFSATYEATKSGAAGVSTLQQPATPTRNIRVFAAQVYCSVACTVTLEAAGAATATASTAMGNVVPGSAERPTAAFYTDSDASAASVPVNKIVIPAGDTKTVKCKDVPGQDTSCFIPKKAGLNYTVRTSSITGDVKVTWFWWED
jgi:hypothetical protein